MTNQYQTTTILYYAFFFPGILLNQITVWAVAGFLNVRAKRSIAWPQKQEIGELNLNFVQLSKNVDPLRLAIISVAPLIIGMLLTWHIANNILSIQTFITMMGQSGFLGNVAEAVGKLTAAQDFWLWVYIAFTISNTMMPKFSNLRGWRIIIGFFVVIVIALYAMGVGNQVVMDNLLGPVSKSLNSLSSIFAIIIGLDIFMVAVLGTLEAIIERVTGDSATFEHGKMITMSRAEMLAQRAKALAVQPKVSKAVAAPSGPPSVYKLQLTIPGAPGKESVTRDEGIIITPDPNLRLPTSTAAPLRSNPAVISGTAAERLPASTEGSPTTTPLRSHPAINAGAETEKPAASTTPRPATAPLSGASSRQAPGLPSGSSSAPLSGTPTRPMPTPSSGSPSAPLSGSPARPATSGSPYTPVSSTPARPMQNASSGSPSAPLSGSPVRPNPGSSFDSPATPKGTSRLSSGSPLPPASPRPPGTSPFLSPAPKPGAPTPKPPVDDIDNEDDEDLDDDVTYEDFEDPA